MKCRFIDTGKNNAFTNMAIDEALLAECSMPTLRVYGWEPKAISIGYNQNVEKEINVEKCQDIDIVRRVTGGKAVFHDNELTYSFILPENALALPKDVTESYRVIAQALVLAFEKIGIKTEIKKQPEKIATPICFNSANWYELTANGKKISGSAQRRIDGKILQHGPLLIDFDHEKNSLLFRSDNILDTLEHLKKRITSIRNELITDISFEELSKAVKYGFQKNFNFDFKDGELSTKEKILVEKLAKEKYSTDEWNLRALKCMTQ